MNRTLTAAVALAAGLGMVGLAQAQMNTPSSQSMSPNPGAAAQQTPGAQGGQANSGMQQTSASPSDVQQAQQQLKSQGLYRGRVDGVMGRETKSALTQFQRQHGLPANAQLDQQTMAQLGGGGQEPQGMTPPTGTQSPATQNPATQNPSAGTGTGTQPGGTMNR